MIDNIENTLKQRGSRYGSAEDNAELTQNLMRQIVNASNGKFSAMHVECLHMICHKISRITLGDCMYSDNAHDIAGYAKLLEEWQVKYAEKEPRKENAEY